MSAGLNLNLPWRVRSIDGLWGVVDVHGQPVAYLKSKALADYLVSLVNAVGGGGSAVIGEQD